MRLENKWIGIAFEAMGTYWHSLPGQQECDRKKHLICREKNVLLLEIWEDWDESIWMNEILKQLNEHTRLELTNEHISKLKYHHGNMDEKD